MVNYKFSVKYSVIVFSKFRNGGVRHRVRRSNLMETKSWSWEAHVMCHYNTFKPPTYSHPSIIRLKYSVQFSSVAQSCLTLCDPMDYSMPGSHIVHQLLELAQTHAHRVGDAIPLSHPLSSPSPSAFNISQHQGLFPMNQFFASGGQSIGALASVLPMHIQD